MFITTKRNPSALDPTQPTMNWPGPRILFTDLVEQTTRNWIASAEVHYIVIDLASPAESRFDALRIAITRVIRARIEIAGPLLFANNGLPGNEVVCLQQAARQDPWLIETTTDPMDGKLSMVVLGERIVANPLFKSFFSSLHEGVTEPQTRECVAMMKEHLIWHKESST